eukprot:6055648-Alexandrium_andersonii.AAC.1
MVRTITLVAPVPKGFEPLGPRRGFAAGRSHAAVGTPTRSQDPLTKVGPALITELYGAVRGSLELSGAL